MALVGYDSHKEGSLELRVLAHGGSGSQGGVLEIGELVTSAS